MDGMLGLDRGAADRRLDALLTRLTSAGRFDDDGSSPFRTRFRGYVKAEVEAFLGEIAESLAATAGDSGAALTPEAVVKKTFAVALFGYDVTEVDEFLDLVEAALGGQP